MGKAREKNVGWRIDYFICSKKIVDSVYEPDILDSVLGSDHCPILLSTTLE